MDEASLKHFLELARKGQHKFASGGEVRAAKLAEALLDYAPGLDQEAADGLREFARLAHALPTQARELLEARKRG